MNLIDSLKKYLLDNVKHLRANPDKLLVFVEKGSLVWVGSGLSHEQHYTSIVELDEWPNLDPNIVMLPILDWYQANQDPVVKIDETLITFETYILSNNTTTVIIAIKLKEAVVATKTPDGYESNYCPA